MNTNQHEAVILCVYLDYGTLLFFCTEKSETNVKWSDVCKHWNSHATGITGLRHHICWSIHRQNKCCVQV